MIIESLSKKLEDSEIDSLSRQESVVDPDVIANKINKNKIIVIPDKFKSDIAALERYAGSSFQSGVSITIALWELLEICPRKRKRADAYTTLIRFLREEMGIKLNIKTQKSKLS